MLCCLTLISVCAELFSKGFDPPAASAAGIKHDGIACALCVVLELFNRGGVLFPRNKRLARQECHHCYD